MIFIIIILVLLYEFIRIFGSVCIQRRTLIQCQTGFPSELVETVLFQFFGENPHVDTDRARAFAGTAIRAATGAVKGP
jgi:hypothetical protein